MVDRTIFTHELEAAAHRCAAMSTGIGTFYIGARDGALQYVGIEGEGFEHFYSLINGEWTERVHVPAEAGDGHDGD